MDLTPLCEEDSLDLKDFVLSKLANLQANLSDALG
jgi:hypothetical protein